jgi:hypothetical protein
VGLTHNTNQINKKGNHYICGVIARTLKKKTTKETNLKFYKIMAVPVLLYGPYDALVTVQGQRKYTHIKKA